jgi:hypothetical protein
LPATETGLDSVADHIAVLTDGSQDAGLAVLINSLVRNGFDGTIWVGWRDGGAALARRLPAAVTSRATVETVELATRRPFTNYKPEFLTEVFELVGPDATSVTYMDCDLVLGCDWAFVRAWLAGGLALVEDLPGRPVPVNHPLRRAWSEFMGTVDVSPARDIGQYFNAGFVGVPACCQSILPVWTTLTRAIERTPQLVEEARRRHYVVGERLTDEIIEIPDHVAAVMRPYLLDDQDALNMAVMATAVPICAMGPDAMGWTGTRTPIVVHATGADKPWSVKYLRRMMRHGLGPSFADDMWWRYSDGPIVVDEARQPERRWAYMLAKLLRRYL